MRLTLVRMATAVGLVCGTTVAGAAVAGSAGAAPRVPTCMGKPATIVADGPFTYGTAGRDVIVGRADDDSIDPRGGRDLVCTRGDGDLVWDYSATRDRVRLGGGNDVIVLERPTAVAAIDGGEGQDYIDYNSGPGVTVDLRKRTDSRGNRIRDIEGVDATGRRDVITGTAGRNVIEGNGGDDTIRGLGGDDTIRWHGVPDAPVNVVRLIGGPGDDRLIEDYRDGSARSVLLGGAGDDVVRGGLAADRVNGGAGNDRVVGGSGNDRYRAGKGHDQLVAGPGDDRMYGGAGRDTWVNWSQLDRNADRVTRVNVPQRDVRDRINDKVFHDRLAGIERYWGSEVAQELVRGSNGRDVVSTWGTWAYRTYDVVRGRGGDDRLLTRSDGVPPQTAAGVVYGGAGHDYCRGFRTHDCEA
jgi:Ca2+-binding RTX toxin-like protein